MSDFKGIPVVTGSKVQKPNGTRAIKNGMKASKKASAVPIGRKPDWLRARLPSGGEYAEVKANVRKHKLATVCEESMCPNIGECWSHGTATIMIMGDTCTRACRFCAVDTGNPHGWLDADEPEHCADSVEIMGLNYIVLTSVDRDDLDDGGAQHYADCVAAIKRRTPAVRVEALAPDFSGVNAHVETVVDSGLEVFAQNIETVERLTHYVRDARAHQRFYADVLGFGPVAEDPGGGFVFMRAPRSDNHHDIAFFTVGSEASDSTAGKGSVGMYHIGWEVATLAELDEIRDRLEACGALEGASNHGGNLSIYSRDPDGLEFDRIVAVLDWEMATIGDPLMDLGTTLAYWIEPSDPEELHFRAFGPTMLPGSMGREELVSRYFKKTGLATDRLHFYCGYGLFKLAVIIQQIYARYVRGHTQDPRFADLSTTVEQLARRGVQVIQDGTLA